MNEKEILKILQEAQDFDYEAFARDLEIEGYTETDYGTVLV